MKIAFIIQRYGGEVLGGSELLCRMVAERLAARHDLEVLTTCARDYITWRNEYPEGVERVGGVRVLRFANARTREIDAFNRFSEWIYAQPHSPADELEWLEQQGPWCPALIDHLVRNQQQYDALVFFTYLYAPTVLGLEVAPAKSLLVPMAHDEPALRLEIFKTALSRPAGLLFNTESERRLVHERFPARPGLEAIAGAGVDLPPYRKNPVHPPASGSGAAFLSRHGLREPFVLYGGRIDAGKNCGELFDYFRSYVAAGGDATLALMGVSLMPLPEDPSVRYLGLLPDSERLEALAAAAIVAVPSRQESLSLLALEALSAGTPILANAGSEVLVEHCLRSRAGLCYANRSGFVERLDRLLRDPELREAMGRRGRDYVREHYRWEVVLAKYELLLEEVRGR